MFGRFVPDVLFFLRVSSVLTDLPLTTLTLDPSSEKLNMKMKKLLATILALGLYAQHAPAQTESHFSSTSATRTLSDSGEANRYVSNASSNAQDMSVLAPTAYGYQSEPTYYEDNTNYSSSYGSYASSSSACNCQPSLWFTAETLLAFGAKRNSPVLVTTAPTNVLPQQGAADVTDAFGGRIESGLMPGYRLSAGGYFCQDKKIGLCIRGYGIYDATQDFELASDGTTSIGIPFLNLNAQPDQQTVPGLVGAAEDAYIVAGNTPGALPISTGSVRAADVMKMVGTDLSGHILMARSGCFRTDLLAGYTYNQLRNRTTLSTVSVNQFTGDAIANGTVLTTQDDFAVENRFNGAHLGVLSTIVRNRVSFTTLAKVAFGSMRSRLQVNGSSTIGGVPDTQGIFAMPTNIGTRTSEHFAFLPELGLKLGYCVRPNIQMTVGYNLLIWSDVMLSGEQMDRAINLSGTGPGPAIPNKHSAYWMQSVDLGLNFTY